MPRGKMKKVDITKQAFIAWVKDPKTRKKYKFEITGVGGIRAQNTYCPLQAWGKDLGLPDGKYATRANRYLSSVRKLLLLRLERNVIYAADKLATDLKKDSTARRLRNLMLKTFGLKEPQIFA